LLSFVINPVRMRAFFLLALIAACAANDFNNLADDVVSDVLNMNQEEQGLESKISSLKSSLKMEVLEQKHLKGTFSAEGKGYAFELIEHEKPGAETPFVTYKLEDAEGTNLLTDQYFPGVEDDAEMEALLKLSNEEKEKRGAVLVRQMKEHHWRFSEGSENIVALEHHKTGEKKDSTKSVRDMNQEFHKSSEMEPFALISFALGYHGISGRTHQLSFWLHAMAMDIAKYNKKSMALVSPYVKDSQVKGKQQAELLEVAKAKAAGHDVADLQTKSKMGWSWRRRRRRRRRHCGNLKTNCCGNDGCYCCECCGRCGGDCNCWGFPCSGCGWNKGCYNHDLACGLKMKNGVGSWLAHKAACWAGLAGFAFGSYGWPPCGQSKTCGGSYGGCGVVSGTCNTNPF